MSFYNESKFNMWRACIGVIWVDGVVAPSEQEWMDKKIDTLKFTDEQKQVLKADLKNNVEMISVLSNITDKRDRAFLCHQIRVIGNLDKDYSTEEKALFEKWHDAVISGLDLEAIEQTIEKMELDSYHEDEVYKVVNKHSLFEKAHRSFQKVLNTDDYKFPEE